MIRRLRISGYKSLKDFSADLSPLSVVFGPNAAGKSNFLDALQLLSLLTTSKTLKQAFEPPYRGRPLQSFTFPAGGLEELLKRETVTFTLSVDVELSESIRKKVENEILEMRKGIFLDLSDRLKMRTAQLTERPFPEEGEGEKTLCR